MCLFMAKAFPSQAEEQQVSFLELLVRPSLEPETSTSISGCATTETNLLTNMVSGFPVVPQVNYITDFKYK